MRYFWLIVFCLLSCGAQARPGNLTLPQMAKQSQAIGICRVESVRQIQGLKFAEVIVLRPIKGCKEGQRFTYLAQATWGCDSARATLGETALLFLKPLETKPFSLGFEDEAKKFVQARQKELRGVHLYQIVHSGNGRMPLKSWGGKEYILQRQFVYWKGIPTAYDPNDGRAWDKIRYAPLEAVTARISGPSSPARRRAAKA